MDNGPAYESLAELSAALAEELGGVTADRTGGRIEYRRGPRGFMVIDGPAVEVRLYPEVAEAVRRTPHVTASSRGPDWIRFEPPAIDRSVLDRADAWFRSAWRAAEG
jgi:hypothetical protein